MNLVCESRLYAAAKVIKTVQSMTEYGAHCYPDKPSSTARLRERTHFARPATNRPPPSIHHPQICKTESFDPGERDRSGSLLKCDSHFNLYNLYSLYSLYSLYHKLMQSNGIYSIVCQSVSGGNGVSPISFCFISSNAPLCRS